MLRLRTASAVAVLFFSLIFGSGVFAQTEDMSQNLARMRNQWDKNPKELEPVYLYVTSAAESPMDKGIVYQNMVSMFAQKGTRNYADDIAKYTDKALELPYRGADLAQMYLDVGDGIIAGAPKGADGAAELQENDRADVASYYLKALRVLLDTISFDDAEMEEKPGASAEDARTVRDHNNMVARKDTCLAYLHDLYGNDSSELDKLKKLASHELGGKGRDDMLLKAMRGEKVGPMPTANVAQAAAVPQATAPAATSDGDSMGAFGAIVALAVAGAGAVFWLLKKRAFS